MATFTGKEIKEKINQNNLAMQKLFSPNTFILNEEIQKLREENAALQSICPHEFESGYCKYCGVKENG